MKKLSILFSEFLLLSLTASAQVGWIEQTSGTTNQLNSVFFVDADNGWAVGDSGTILKTTNGGIDWNTKLIGTTENISCVQFTDNNVGWVLMGWKLLKTTNQGEDWEIAFSDTQYSLRAFYFVNNDTGWVSSFNLNTWGNLYKTINGGLNWQIQGGIPAYIYKDIFFVDSYNGWMIGTHPLTHHSWVWKTTDGGVNWIQIDLPWPFCDTGVNSIYFVDGETGWLTRGWVSDAPGGFVTKTMDGGYNWQVPPQTYGNTEGGFFDVFFTDTSTGWVVGGWDSNWGPGSPGGEILCTTNGGSDWTQQYFEDQRALTSIYFVDSYTGWAVGSRGIILKTTTGGIPVELTSFTASISSDKVTLNWSTATETNNSGFEILRSAQDGKWDVIGFMAGHGTTTEPQTYSFTDDISNIISNSIAYRLKQIDFDGSFEYSDVIYVDNLVPAEFTLHQNYPNPFNSTTIIKYSIPESGIVSIKIYNILGEEVAKLVNELKQIGNYEISLNADDLTSGTYLYRLQAGKYVETKKMILLK